MRILVYGAGVIGSIFAAKLHFSGLDVTILARGKRLEEIQKSGIVLCNAKMNKTETARIKVINQLHPDMKFNYILVVMQKIQVDSVLESLSQNCTENIVFIVNTAAGYDQWKQAIGEERLMLGFPSAGGERRNGVVRYFIGKGLMRAFQTTTFGEASEKRTQRVSNLIHLFKQAGIPSVFCTNMDAWQKTHVAMVTSIANALYKYKCDNRQLAASYQDVKEMVLGVREGFAVLKTLGIQPTPRKLGFWELPSGILTVIFKLFMATQLAEVTMAKHCIVARNEMIYLQAEFDSLVEKSGLKTPHIDVLRDNLTRLYSN